MITLSYSTMNSAINEPHTWINKQMGLKTYSNKYMDAGKAAHRIIQDHMCGKIVDKALEERAIPLFNMVEEKDFDPRLEVKMPINDKYNFHGYVDAMDVENKRMGEIKTGSAWSPGKFAALVQWKLYMLSRPDMKEIYMINTPSDPNLWMPETIKVFKGTLTPKDKIDAEKFISKAINVIDNIKDQNLRPEKKSYWCYYIGCEFCPKE